MRKGIAISAAALAMTAMAAVVAPPASASAPFFTRGPNGVTIEIATVNGSGCPAGTAAVAISDDKEAFTVTYSDYMAQVGGSSPATDFRKNCQINMKVHVPQGFTYAIMSADYRGFASLEPGASALEKAHYYFQGMQQTGKYEHPIKGAYGDNWQFTDVNDIAQLVYKPCGEERNFNINTELRVNKGTSEASKVSFIAMDSVDTTIKTTYRFAWKRCP